IGDGDRRCVRLGLDADAGLVVGERDLACAPGDLDGEIEEFTHRRLHGRSSLLLWTSIPASARTRLTAATEVVPSWKIPAARAASAPAVGSASRKCAGAPAPPLAMTGTSTASTTRRISSRS